MKKTPQNFDPNEWEIINNDLELIDTNSELLHSIICGSKKTISEIYAILCKAPSVMSLLKSGMQETMYIADLSDEQKAKIAKGQIKFLRRKKDGACLATLFDSSTKDFSSNVPLKEISLTPELSNALDRYSAQLQMARMAQKIDAIQKEVESVRSGLENDRLATAYSCQQKFVQIKAIRNATLRESALLRLVMDAEDSRNICMLSQKANVELIKRHPETIWGKICTTTTREDINSHLEEIRDSLYAINMTSLVEVAAYQLLGEDEAALASLRYFSTYIKETFLDTPGLIERFNQLDKSPNEYWANMIPSIVDSLMDLSAYSIPNLPTSSEVN